MKTIKMKFLLPVAALMFAITAAFASQKNEAEIMAPQQGYIIENGICKKHGTCDDLTGSPICRDNLGRQVFGLSTTNCIQLLYMNWHP